jgi:cyanophycinase
MNTPFLLAAALLAAPPETPKGRLVVVGGGSDRGGIGKHMIQLAGGPDVPMLLMPQSSSSANAAESSLKHWSEQGAKNLTVADADDIPKTLELIKKAQIIWIGGGDQNRFMKAFAGTDVPQAIRDRYRQGATVGGTSAGAAVMSEVMITGDAQLNAVKGGATKTAQGLGLWPHVIVDQHFVARQRFNRLLSAVLDRPELVGVGIDEGTAAIVTGSKFEVFGVGQIVVVDARQAKAMAKTDELSAGVGVRLHVLKPGMTFDLTESSSRTTP